MTLTRLPNDGSYREQNLFIGIDTASGEDFGYEALYERGSDGLLRFISGRTIARKPPVAAPR